MPKAIFWCVGIGTLTMFVCGYVGMLVVPDWKDYIGNENWMNTVLFQVSKMTGGEGFGIFFTAGYLTELAVFNLVATAAGARLLYGMGRDNLLPKSIFAKINKKWKTPHWSILIIVTIEFILGISANMTTLSNLVNYGALFGFAALNLSVIWLYYVKKKGESSIKLGSQANWSPKGAQHIRYFLLPLLAFFVIIYVWVSMDKLAQIIGTAWLVLGFLYLVIKTRGFRKLPPQLHL
ncbi:APC family permease [Cytobacillus sp. Hz8]|uniref:APC family permease n=1 Tax=Cytobacillus sp. Hz8 TaxID=3347168 RepID=UPI0035DCE7BD